MIATTRTRESCIGETFHAILRDRISHWERIVLFVLLGVAVGFGINVEMRSALSHSRHTDLDVYLRGAWTIRTGQDTLYKIRDDNNWPYLYPPLFAIVMAPLADPPANVSHAGYVPFAVSVGLWYTVCLAALALAVHALANACERAWHAPYSKHSRGWWAMRMVPLLICLPGIGSDLARGQVNLIVLLLLAFTIASAMRHTPKGSYLAGIFLGAAICLKVIPLFLLVYPLRQLDWRWLAASTVTMAIGLIAIPLAVVGQARTTTYYHEFAELTLGSALLGQGDALHATETVNAADNQSLTAVMQNTLFGHDLRTFLPHDYTRRIRGSIAIITAFLLATTLLAPPRRRIPALPPDPLTPSRRTALTLSALILVMLLVSPVCHMAYFGLCLPLVMTLLATLLERFEYCGSFRRTGEPLPYGRGSDGVGGTALAPPVAPNPTRWRKLLLTVLGAYVLIGLLVRLPGLDPLRHAGLAMYSVLALWVVGVYAIRHQMPGTSQFEMLTPSDPATAATL